MKSPIIIASKNKDEKWFYSLKDYEEQKPNLAGYKIRYIKGLGSLNRNEYEKVINEPKYEVVKLDSTWKDKFEMLFGDNPDLRKTWMMA